MKRCDIITKPYIIRTTIGLYDTLMQCRQSLLDVSDYLAYVLYVMPHISAHRSISITLYTVEKNGGLELEGINFWVNLLEERNRNCQDK